MPAWVAGMAVQPAVLKLRAHCKCHGSVFTDRIYFGRGFVHQQALWLDLPLLQALCSPSSVLYSLLCMSLFITGLEGLSVLPCVSCVEQTLGVDYTLLCRC